MNAHAATIKCANGFTNSFSGRSNQGATIAINEQGLYGFLPGENKPYMPIGGWSVLADLNNQGVLIYKKYTFSAGCIITKGRKL